MGGKILNEMIFNKLFVEGKDTFIAHQNEIRYGNIDV